MLKLADQNRPKPLFGSSEAGDETAQLIALVLRFIDESNAIVGGTRVRDAHMQVEKHILIRQPDDAAGAGSEGLSQLQLHAFRADLFAAPLLA